MRPSCCLLALLIGWFVAQPAPAKAAGSVRLVATDERGVTLQLDLPEHRLAPGADGRSQLVAPGFQAMEVPGRAVVPFVSVLVALPQGAGAVARLVDGGPEQTQSDVRLAITGRPGFRADEKLGTVPVREPVEAILDGPWPTTAVEIGEPFVWRRQRLVNVSFRPFRYDEASRRLWTRDGMTVRVEFTGATGASLGTVREDAHWEPALRQAVINYQQARAWREPQRRGPSPSGSLFDRPAGIGRAAVVDDDFPEVRVRIDSTGVYQIPFEAVADAGYPTGVPVDRVSVHRHEFREGEEPPYETIELAIEVDDTNSDTFFGLGDRILVFVPSWAERSRVPVTQRLWGDAEMIYVTQVAGLGRRIPPKAGWRNVVGLIPPTSYPWSQHWEENHYYSRFPADTSVDQFHWTQNIAYYSRPALGRIPTNHIDLGRPVEFNLNIVGRSTSFHIEFAEVRNGLGQGFAVMDSVIWSGTGYKNATVTLAPGALSEGDVNGLHLWGKNNLSAPCMCNIQNPTCTNCFDSIGLNYYDVTYWRSYRALQSYLSFNSGDQLGETQLHATGFSSASIRVYDVTDSLNPLRVTLDPARIVPDGSEFAFDFQDLVLAGERRRYVGFVVPKPLAPGAVSRVERRHLGTRGAGDYLLIVPEAFLDAVGTLVALRESQNIDVVLAPLEAVCDEFNGGRKSAHAIKRFVRYAYERWNAKFVLLVGDGNEDPMNLLGVSSPDWIPVKKIKGPVGVEFGTEVVVSDPWYGCMSDCSLNGSVPAFPDVSVGRLPVQNLAQAQDVVNKIVTYETSSSSGDQSWRNQLLLSADDDYSGISLFGGGGSGSGNEIQVCRSAGETVFEQLNDEIARIVSDDAGLKRTRIDKFYLGDLLGNEACVDPNDPSCPCRKLDQIRAFTRGGPTMQLLSRLSAGCLWWNFQGHANEFVLTHENLYQNEGGLDDANSLFNNDRPFLFSAFSCHANAFARAAGDAALGEELITRPRAGAIASWASSGYEILPGNGFSHINVELARSMFLDPPVDDYFDGNGARVLAGEAINLALARYVPGVVFNPTEKGIGLTYNLLGDPATRLSLGAPQTIVTANGDTIVSDRPVALSPPRDTLHLEAEIVSNARIDSLVLIENSVTVVPASSYTVTPAFPDNGAASHGGRRYHLSFTTPIRAGLLRYTIHTRDRYGLITDFNLVLQFFTQLELAGNRLVDNDPVLPTAQVALRVAVPAPITDPQTQFKLEVDNQPQAFTATSLELTGREWRLDWTHAPYALGTHTVELTALDSLNQTRTFRVVEDTGVAGGLLRDALAFPNPFDEQIGTSLSFYLLADAPAAVLLRVFTLSGRTIYQRREHGLSPGYHQWAWDGRDAEGDLLANGTYLFTLTCTAGSRSDAMDGRLVKLRRPRRGDDSQP